MFDDNEPLTKSSAEITLGCDLSTFSIEDIDECIALLQQEIVRLEEDREKKKSNLDSAQSFFKI